MRREGVQGEDPSGSCTAGSPSDADTQQCIQKAEDKAAGSIDKVCEKPDAKPSCYAPPRDSGAGWVATVENLIDAQAPFIYCSAPSTTTSTSTTTPTTTSTSVTVTTTSTSTTTTTIYGSPSRAFLIRAHDLLE